MNILVGVVIPILMIVLGIYISYKIHRTHLLIWKEEFKIEELLVILIPTLLKSFLIMFLIIIIHNSVHSDHFVELLLFVLVFFVFSIIQSSFSLGSFMFRFKNLKKTTIEFFKDKTKRADKFIHRLYDSVDGMEAVFFKVIIIFAFILIFLPNITIFITTNIIYITLILVFLIASLLLNNIIYFGIVSLMIFQFNPVSLSFDNANYIVLFSSYLVILLGLSLDNRLDSKMFSLIRVMEVKKFNFELGYDLLKQTNRIQVYQNKLNKYYFVYFRLLGLVVVYHTDIDIKLSNNMIKKLIDNSKRFLIKNNEPV